jgi:hypothetical protein
VYYHDLPALYEVDDFVRPDAWAGELADVVVWLVAWAVVVLRWVVVVLVDAAVVTAVVVADAVVVAGVVAVVAVAVPSVTPLLWLAKNDWLVDWPAVVLCSIATAGVAGAAVTVPRVS